MPSPQESLLNLQKIGKLKAEPPDKAEFDGLIRSASRKLPDAENTTLSFPTAKWRFLDHCHQKRNVALYDGDYSEDKQLIEELIAVTRELLSAVKALGPIAH